MAVQVEGVSQRDTELEELEIGLLLEAVYRRYGYDFRQYARASVARRLRQHVIKSGAGTIAGLIPQILHDEASFQALARDLSITVTEMFRDPSFYAALRQHVVPFLRTFPFVNIWHAGCATGEEVYSLAILLTEEDLYDRVRIYATDFNEAALQKARERIYPLDKIQQYTANYQQAGGAHSFADYYRARYDAVILDPALAANVTFASHNLVTDGVFAEMHLILCRNVLIYFDRTLQGHVLALLRNSLRRRGFLCLGSKESLEFSPVHEDFIQVVPQEPIYREKGWKVADADTMVASGDGRWTI
jgi:chemotaxis protein methyltransferase CheR